jgi:nucleotide-binding universal stress UspA family protein
MKPQHLLVPLDLSRHSLEVFGFLNELGSLLGRNLKLTVLSVLEDRKHILSVVKGTKAKPRVLDKLEATVTKELQQLILKYLPGTEAKILITRAKHSVADEIVKIANSGKFDALAMTTHGHTGIARLILGSVTERVLAQSDIPVFVVPSRKRTSTSTIIRAKRIVNIIALADFKKPERKFYREVRDQYENYSSKGVALNLVHIIEDILVASYHISLGSNPEEIWAEREQMTFEKLEQLRDKHFSGMPVMTTAIRQSGSIAETALAFARSHRASLLIAGKHKRKGLNRWILGSVAEKLVRHSNQPVLVVPTN